MTESEAKSVAGAASSGEAERWRQAAPRILEALAVNAVPLWGLFHGWSFSTLLVLFWCENLLNTIFVGGRIWLHRRLTRKRGHWTVAQTLQVTTTINGRTTRSSGPRRTTLLASFVFANLIFTLAHGVFVAVFVFLVLPGGPTLDDLEHGIGWLAAAMTVSFVLDAAKIRSWSFAMIRQRCDIAIGRVVVVHLALIGGAFLLSMTAQPSAFFAAFIALKLLFDLATAQPPARLDPGRMPRWLGWLRGLGKPGELDKAWSEVASDELRKEHDDEEVLDHAPA